MRGRKLPRSRGTNEIMPRALAALAAALVAALTLAHAPARAEPQAGASGPPVAVGQPLNITPSLRPFRKVHRSIERPAHQAERPAAAKPPPRVVHHRAVQPARLVARSHSGQSAPRGEDGSSLLAILPWWRADPMEPIRYLDREAGSGVLAAADAWLAAANAENRGSVDEGGGLGSEVDIANADDLNAMDLIAAAVADPRKSDNGWLHALLALLGGALAAASTARYLFG
jgi:hypothetical protein